MSLPETTGKVANNIVDAFRTQPLMLVVLLMNALIFAFIYYTAKANRESQIEITKAMLDQNVKAQEMLSRCIVPRTNAKSPLFLPNKGVLP